MSIAVIGLAPPRRCASSRSSEPAPHPTSRIASPGLARCVDQGTEHRPISQRTSAIFERGDAAEMATAEAHDSEMAGEKRDRRSPL
jgi:hypothetical protein